MDYPILKFSRMPKIDGGGILADVHKVKELRPSGVYWAVSRSGKRKLLEIKFFDSFTMGYVMQVIREVPVNEVTNEK